MDTSEQLFAVLCALHAAGYEQELAATGMHPLRGRLRAELLRLQGPELEQLRKFYLEHRPADSTAALSRFVSFALVVGPPPKFAFEMPREQLPPDALALEEFNEVLGDFYRAAEIGRRWAALRPEYEREVERLREPLGQAVLVSTSYLREILRPASGRTFTLYVEPLVGPRTNLRNFGDRYILVVSPSAEAPVEEIRHAFLHFLLDPLVIRHKDAVERLQPLLHYAAKSPRLPVEFKDDFPSFLTECLVRAVDLRLRRLSGATLARTMDDAEQDGYVLVRPLVAALEVFQKAEPAMSFFFPDMLAQVNVAAEARRLESVAFAAARPAGAQEAGQPPAVAHTLEESEVNRTLREAERQIAAQDGEAAAALFQRVLEREPGHPRALYGLALAAVLQGEVDRAKELFRQLLGSQAMRGSPGSGSRPVADARIRAWSHIYLGRIYDQEGSRELAMSEYRAALSVEGAPETARAAAQQGMDKGYGPTPRPPRP